MEIDVQIVINKLRERLSDLEWKNVLLEVERDQLRAEKEALEKKPDQ